MYLKYLESFDTWQSVSSVIPSRGVQRSSTYGMVSGLVSGSSSIYPCPPPSCHGTQRSRSNSYSPLWIWTLSSHRGLCVYLTMEHIIRTFTKPMCNPTSNMYTHQVLVCDEPLEKETITMRNETSNGPLCTWSSFEIKWNEPNNEEVNGVFSQSINIHYILTKMKNAALKQWAAR